MGQSTFSPHFLDEFNSDFCSKMLDESLGKHAWDELINSVLEKNLFLFQIENVEFWVRYHHLFRDFLQIQFEIEKPEKFRIVLKNSLPKFC